ncbi:MAG TPA: DNA alkylation repair protein [Bacilli bacterium]|nr:DNA alkylation repair protein [Bacilli bacterium]HPS19053.1 DNA alkylation repair protein [Bacilli bacterium]
MIYEQTKQLLSKIKKIKTADIDTIAKQYLKEGVDVSPLYPHIDESGAMFRIYFVVSLKRIKKYEEQIEFIERHFEHLHDWWHVDILIQLLVKAPSFEYVYQKAKKYVKSPLLFVRRWGYVIFLSGFQKDPKLTRDILALFHDDEEYYVQMAEAWLLADLAIYNPEVVLDFIASKPLRYDIIGKGVQKMSDSFRISDEIKAKAKDLRKLYK